MRFRVGRADVWLLWKQLLFFTSDLPQIVTWSCGVLCFKWSSLYCFNFFIHKFTSFSINIEAERNLGNFILPCLVLLSAFPIKNNLDYSALTSINIKRHGKWFQTHPTISFFSLAECHLFCTVNLNHRTFYHLRHGPWLVSTIPACHWLRNDSL